MNTPTTCGGKLQKPPPRNRHVSSSKKPPCIKTPHLAPHHTNPRDIDCLKNLKSTLSPTLPTTRDLHGESESHVIIENVDYSNIFSENFKTRISNPNKNS